MGGDALKAETKSLNISTRTMQKKLGDQCKQEIDANKWKGRKEEE